MAQTEPFPALRTRTNMKDSPSSPNGAVRPRRKSSSLGGDPRGDTGGAALATLSSASSASLSRNPSDRTRPHSKRRKARSLLRRYWRYSLRQHTWLNPLILIIIFLSLYALDPTPSNPLHQFIFLSYPIPRPEGVPSDTPIQYGKGGSDFCFIAFYTVVFSFTREFLMQRMIRPLAIRLGIHKRAKQARFMEQFYTAVYFAFMGPFGIYVMKRTPIWYFNTTAMYEGFPHRSHIGIFKAYYLLQAAYWTQQAIVLLLMLEKPRKDFKELCLHHAVTIALIWCSYRFHFTYMGIAVYITHDISDFFLATSKCLNYIDHWFTGPYFGFFIFVWAYTRHWSNLRILYSILTEFATVGPYELNWETQQYKCWISQIITFALLLTLQIVNLFWFYLILRIAYRFVVTRRGKDERSDDEDEDEDTKAEEELNKLEGPGVNAAAEGPKLQVNGQPVSIDSEVAQGKENVKRRR